MASSRTRARRSLKSGLLASALLFSAATVATLAVTVGVVAVRSGTRAEAERLLAAQSAGIDVLASVTALAIEPSGRSWDGLRSAHERLASALRSVPEGSPAPSGSSVPERFGIDALDDRLESTEEAVAGGGLGAESASDRRAFLAALASYRASVVATLEEIGRSVAEGGSEASRLEGLLLVAAVIVALFGILVSSSYVVGFARATVGDARALADYGAALARGEYPGELLLDRRDELGQVAAGLGSLMRLEKALHEVHELDGSFQGGARLMGRQATEAAARIATQSERVDSAVKMLDEIVQAMQNVHMNARRSLETAEESGQEIGRSIEKLLQGAADVEQLEGLTNRIGEIVALISSIADQTDILSLNAGIEAARAGTSGRGFTVVAGEVRKLADKSGRSALEISELTQSILAVVEKIAARTDEESLVMSAIQKGLARITDAVGEVAKLSAYTRDNVERLSKAIDEVTGGIAESKREARELVKTTQNLKVDVDRLHMLGSSGGFAISAASRFSWAAADGESDGGGAASARAVGVPAPEAAGPAPEPGKPGARRDQEGRAGGGTSSGKGASTRAATREETGASGTRATAGGAQGAGDRDTGGHGAAAGGRATHGGSNGVSAPESADEIEELEGAD